MMEYGIHFGDDDTNKIILSALEELENTFFNENSSSENEKSTTNDDESTSVISDDENDENDENFSKMALNNFEFMENSEDYDIEDEVYYNSKLKAKTIFENGKCSCNPNCFEKIGFERFLAHRVEFESLDKKMRDMVIKGQLMAFQKDENSIKVSANNRKRLRFTYHYNNDLQICCVAYLALVGVSRNYLEAINQHLQDNGLEERIHGNTERAPKNMKRVEVNYNIACEVYEFLKNYANIYGMPSPGRHFNKISMPVVFLPTSYSYASVYRDYVQACEDNYESNEARIMSQSTFTNIWRALMPSLQFMSPKSDLCEICETMKLEIQYTTEHDKKLAVTENYLAHLNRCNS